MKQCWPAVSPRAGVTGGRGLPAGASHVLQHGFGCQVILHSCLAIWQFFASFFFYPQPSHPSGLGKYVVSILVSTVFQCDGAWWLPLTGFSWIPYMFGLV